MTQLNQFLQPVDSPVANQLAQKQATTFERTDIIPPDFIDYTNLNPAARPYVAVVSLNREKGTFFDIQEAINYAVSVGGGDVYFKEGTYVPGKNILLQSGIRLITNPNFTTIIDFEDIYTLECESNTTIENIQFNNHLNLLINNREDVLLKNLSFSSQDVATVISIIEGFNIVIENCIFTNGDIAISLIDSTTIFIEKCSFNSIDTVCIDSDCESVSQNYSIKNCNTTSDFQFFRGDFAESTMTNNYISTVVNPSYAINIYCVSNSNGIIDEFFISNNTLICNNGLFMGTVKNANISGNVITGVGTASNIGIGMSNASKIATTGNVVRLFTNGSSNAIALSLSNNSDQNTVTGNYLEYGGGASSYSIAIGAGCDFNAVTGNAFNGGTINSGASNVFSGNSG